VGGAHAKKRTVGGEAPARRPSQTASSIAMFAAPSVGSVTSRRQVEARGLRVTPLASHIAGGALRLPRAPSGTDLTEPSRVDGEVSGEKTAEDDFLDRRELRHDGSDGRHRDPRRGLDG